MEERKLGERGREGADFHCRSCSRREGGRREAESGNQGSCTRQQGRLSSKPVLVALNKPSGFHLDV